MWHASVACLTLKRAVGTSQENESWSLIDNAVGFINTGHSEIRAKQGMVVKKGETQSSNMLSGMPKKREHLVSDLRPTGSKWL